MLTEEQIKKLATILAPTIEQIIAVAPQIAALLVAAHREGQTQLSEHQSQEYRGNGNHEWEQVTAFGDTTRLRVPGGWLYSTAFNVKVNMVFVPMPEVVKHKV